jgi:hypothetical protein
VSIALYDLPRRYAVLADIRHEDESNVTEDPVVQRVLDVNGHPRSDTGLHEALNAIRDEAQVKALSLAKVVKNLEAEVKLLEEHTRLLYAKAQARLDRADYLRRMIRLELEAAGLDRVKDPFVTAWLQQPPPAVVIVAEERVPPEFMRAVLGLPYALVPPQLRGHVKHLDVDRAVILALLRRTGQVPDGIAIRTGERHLRVR